MRNATPKKDEDSLINECIKRSSLFSRRWSDEAAALLEPAPRGESDSAAGGRAGILQGRHAKRGRGGIGLGPLLPLVSSLCRETTK